MATISASEDLRRKAIYIGWTWWTGCPCDAEWAIPLFQQGRLSFGKAREMAGMTVWAFQQILGSREIPVHYDVDEYEEDLATLKTLGRL